MPTRNAAEAAAFLPAIEALGSELSRIEQEAAGVRALLEGLRAYAGMANAPAMSPGGAAAPSSAPKSGMSKQAAAKLLGVDHKTIQNDLAKKSPKNGEKVAAGKVPATGSAATKARIIGGLKSKPPKSKDDAPTPAVGKGSSGGSKSEPPEEKAKPSPLAVARSDRQRSKADDEASAAELRKVAATIAEAAEHVAAAKRGGDFERLKSEIERVMRAERSAGVILLNMSRHVPPMPGTRGSRSRWRHAALLDAAAFEEKVRAAQRRALAEVGAPFAVLDAIGAAPAKPERAKDNRPTHAASPKVTMKIGDWREEPDGTRSRLLTNEVEDGGQVAGLPS